MLIFKLCVYTLFLRHQPFKSKFGQCQSRRNNHSGEVRDMLQVDLLRDEGSQLDAIDDDEE